MTFVHTVKVAAVSSGLLLSLGLLAPKAASAIVPVCVPPPVTDVDFVGTAGFCNTGAPEHYTLNFFGECLIFSESHGLAGDSFCHSVGFCVPSGTSIQCFSFQECLAPSVWELCLQSTTAASSGTPCGNVTTEESLIFENSEGLEEATGSGLYAFTNSDPLTNSFAVVNVTTTPEIDASWSAAPLAFTAGLLLLLSDRRKRSLAVIPDVLQ